SLHGSGICRIAGFSRLEVDSVQQSELSVQMKGADRSYPAILATFTAEELLTVDPSVGTYPAALELKTTTEEPDVDDALIFNERTRPDPP
ncbi:MAG TPA: hypothetical protein VHO25_04585, partial [Polyangiaceae bacterium]|nr:hypothetical protein [Polyangiaceae bacterium]